MLEPTDPVVAEPLWRNRQPAERFEAVVARRGVHRWTEARLDAVTRGGRVLNLRHLLRQVLTTTTVNLTSSMEESRRVAGLQAGLDLPWTFFLDTDTWSNVLELDLDLPAISVSGADYAAEIAAAGMRIEHRDSGFHRAGETHFAFLVPERSFEDVSVVAGLLKREILSARLLACLLAVDLSNPIYSQRRSELLAYFPSECAVGSAGADLDGLLPDAVDRSSAPVGSAERDFGRLWDETESTDWRTVVGDRIHLYWKAVSARAKTREGVRDIVRLADSRRRRFLASHLAEFALTLPRSDLADTDNLRMELDGTVLS